VLRAALGLGLVASITIRPTASPHIRCRVLAMWQRHNGGQQRHDFLQPARRTARPRLRIDAGNQVSARSPATRLHRADQARRVRLEERRTRGQSHYVEDHDAALQGAGAGPDQRLADWVPPDDSIPLR
jgi:hypothetical protein